MIDSRVVGSAGIAGHGTLSVAVGLKRTERRLGLSLFVHGGEYLGIGARRWRDWGRQCELDVGQTIRIEVGQPDRLDLGAVREVVRNMPRTKRELRAHIAMLRRWLRHSATWAREADARDRKRPPPRSDPRTSIRAD